MFKKIEAEGASLESYECYTRVLEPNLHVRRETSYEIHVMKLTKLDIYCNQISPQKYKDYSFLCDWESSPTLL
jgi:hypothetical protein